MGGRGEEGSERDILEREGQERGGEGGEGEDIEEAKEGYTRMRGRGWGSYDCSHSEDAGD